MNRLQMLFCAGVLVVGCGGSGSEEDSKEELRPPAMASCFDLSRGMCSDADTNGFEPTQILALQAFCMQNGGVAAMSACPEEGRVGTCAATQVGVPLQVRYYDSHFSAAEAQASCARGPGTTWTPN